MSQPPSPSHNDHALRLRRLRFRAWHRGTRELDLLIGSFADANLATMESGDLDILEELLAAPDPDVYAWITGAADAPNAGLQALVEQLRQITLSPSDYPDKT